MKELQVLNIRRGFATNSSSSHSIIYSNDRKDSDCESGEFGWQRFVAASKQMKQKYLSLTVFENLLSLYYKNNELIENIKNLRLDCGRKSLENTHKLLGFKSDINIDKEGYVENGYIDHQSIYCLPVEFNNNIRIDTEFLKDFRDFFLQDDLVILGGNDNDCDDNYFPVGFKLPIKQDGPKGTVVARKDLEKDFWTVYDRQNGNKIRFRFVETCKKMNVPEKSFAPELLDIKITDACRFASEKDSNACSKFCYQNAKIKGKHAKFEDIVKVAEYLSKLKVFEVALGGGEPTDHPQFFDILKAFRYRGIIPNFTTRNKEFFIGKKYEDDIFRLIGGIAYSVRNAEEVIEINNILENNLYFDHTRYYNEFKFSVQVAMGTITKEEFEKIISVLKDCKHIYCLTLLGYKYHGRGISYFKNYIEYNWWLDVLDKYKKNYLNVSVDTVMATQFEDEFKKLKINKLTYHTEEGKFSGYIDAVQGTFAPSSFSDESLTVDLFNGEEDWTNRLDEKIIEYYKEF